MTRGKSQRRSGPRRWQHVRPLQVRLEAGGASAASPTPGHILGMDPDIALAEALDLALRVFDGEAEAGDDVHLAALVSP